MIAAATMEFAPNTDKVEPIPYRRPVDGISEAVEHSPYANIVAGVLADAGAVVVQLLEAGAVTPKLKVAADGWAPGVVPNVNIFGAASVLTSARGVVDEAVDDVPKAAIRAMKC